MLVEIDNKRFVPIRYSQSFVFRKIGIEFCIGFCFEDLGKRTRFWLSQHDRDPIWISVPFDHFIWNELI